MLLYCDSCFKFWHALHGVCSKGVFSFITLPATLALVVYHVYSMVFMCILVLGVSVHNRGL